MNDAKEALYINVHRSTVRSAKAKEGQVFTKVCGLKTKAQVDTAIEYGYDAIGVVTYPKSKRYCPPDEAIRLAKHARGRIKSFVVGMTYADVQTAAPFFDYTQIYETKPIPNLALAADKPPPTGLEYAYFVYDASVGSGEFKAFPPWLNTVSGRLIVAGGLNARNVGQVIHDLKPFGVDVSSGVEKDGVKDVAMMKAFIDAVRRCEAQKREVR